MLYTTERAAQAVAATLNRNLTAAERRLGSYVHFARPCGRLWKVRWIAN
jgi:hypothetical protein